MKNKINEKYTNRSYIIIEDLGLPLSCLATLINRVFVFVFDLSSYKLGVSKYMSKYVLLIELKLLGFTHSNYSKLLMKCYDIFSVKKEEDSLSNISEMWIDWIELSSYRDKINE